MDFEKLTAIAEAEITKTLAGLPGVIRKSAARVPVFLERAPDPDDIAAGIKSNTLGLFDQGTSDVPMPRIRIWLANLWDLTDGDEADFRREVRITLLHEFGHFFGWNEDDLDARGLG